YPLMQSDAWMAGAAVALKRDIIDTLRSPEIAIGPKRAAERHHHRHVRKVSLQLADLRLDRRDKLIQLRSVAVGHAIRLVHREEGEHIRAEGSDRIDLVQNVG